MDRITLEPDKRGGKPCIRGLRITVYDILEYLASGMTEAEILADFPDLEREDIWATLTFAAERERRLLGELPAGFASEGHLDSARQLHHGRHQSAAAIQPNRDSRLRGGRGGSVPGAFVGDGRIARYTPHAP